MGAFFSDRASILSDLLVWKKKTTKILYHLPDKKSHEFIVENLIYTALLENASSLMNNSIRLTFIFRR